MFKIKAIQVNFQANAIIFTHNNVVKALYTELERSDLLIDLCITCH